MRTYLITGITGTIGKIVAKRLLCKGHNVVGISRDEYKQQNMFKHENLKLYIGDIKDPSSLYAIKESIDLIFHFAALKHIDICGKNPYEAVKTNIEGTQRIVEFQQAKRIPQIVLTSTDKAFKPINQYGKTKGIAENLVATNPFNAICRYGNVFGSRGSVIDKFLASIKESLTVNITDPTMTRFFMTQSEAASFVVGCEGRNGIHIPKMKSTDLRSLADACVKYLNVKEFVEYTVTGNRGAEKIHEEMSDDYNSETAERFTIDELIEMIAEHDKCAQ